MHSHTHSPAAHAQTPSATGLTVCLCVCDGGVNNNQLIMDIQCKYNGGNSSGLCNSLKEKVKLHSLPTATVGADKMEFYKWNENDI